MSDNKSNTGKILITVILLVVIASLAGGAAFLWKQEREEQQAILEEANRLAAVEISNPDMPEEYRPAAAHNEDVFGWIAVPGTSISCPLVQAEDDYYSSHNIEKEEDSQGAVYTLEENPGGFTAFDTVLYGNYQPDTLFGELLNYEDPAYFEDHRAIEIYLPDKTLHFRIYATYSGDDSDLPEDKDFSKEKTIRRYLKKIREQRGLKTNVDETMEVNASSRLLTLVTEHPASSDKKFFVRAVLENS